MTNLEIAQILYQISEILEMQDIQFKPRAYQRAALSIESLSGVAPAPQCGLTVGNHCAEQSPDR